MSLQLTIWIIGWLFTLGLAKRHVEKEKYDFLVLIFGAIVLFFLWPQAVGEEISDILEKKNK